MPVLRPELRCTGVKGIETSYWCFIRISEAAEISFAEIIYDLTGLVALAVVHHETLPLDRTWSPGGCETLRCPCHTLASIAGAQAGCNLHGGKASNLRVYIQS